MIGSADVSSRCRAAWQLIGPYALLAFMGAVVPLLLWGVWYFITGSVPEATSIPFPDGDYDMVQIALPFAVSRWLDVPVGAAWAVLLGLMLAGMRRADLSEGAKAAIGVPWLGVFFGCLIISSVLYQFNGGPTIAAIVAANLIVPCVISLVPGIIVGITNGPLKGVAAALSYILVALLTAQIVIGPAAAVVTFMFGLVMLLVSATFSLALSWIYKNL